MPEESMGGASESCTRVKEVVKQCSVEDVRRPYEELGKYRVLGVIGQHVMLVLCSHTQQCYAMKVIQKSCNQIPDEDYFTKPSENRLPILPADIPYMVKLVAFVETPNLLFLLLQYSSGGKLFDYIENYAKSVPNTPAREVNLDNVFIDLGAMNKTAKSAKDVLSKSSVNQHNNGSVASYDTIRNRDINVRLEEIGKTKSGQINLSSIDEKLSQECVDLKEAGAVILKQTRELVKQLEQEYQIPPKDLVSNANNADHHKNYKVDKVYSENNNICEKNLDNNLDLSVTDIVINSQRLLLNVDDALSGFLVSDSRRNVVMEAGSCGVEEESPPDRLGSMVSRVERAFDGIQEKLDQFLDDDTCQFKIVANRSALPPKALCKWSAELLVAIDHLHQSGVICRDLNPSNLLLGEHGHLSLTYMVGRDCSDSLMRLLEPECRTQTWRYVAPELRNFPLLMRDEAAYDHRLADFWSYGAVLYELITGVPLSLTHPSGFNSHTILNFPRDMPRDAESLLSQLLCYDPCERLGSGRTKIDEIKSHSYFKHIDWNIVEEDYIFDSRAAS